MESKKTTNLPPPPRFAKLIGPSIILLGLGLGSGELILWPYLVANYGLGIIWAALIGITMQFFINMEIERYTLVKGESVFVGFSKMFRFAPYWFIFSTFIAWFWPGIIATSAKIFSDLIGVESFQYVGIFALILIGLILSLGKSLYKTVENFQKTLILIGLPIITFITLMIAKSSDYSALGTGILGNGDGYKFLPQGIDLFVLLGALAYSGAGGNLNLAQSFYVKEKGYGMCKGTSGIQSLLFGKSKRLSLEGRSFAVDQKNIAVFHKWWKLINAEHFLVFLLTGAVTIMILALLSYSTVYGSGATLGGIKFIQLQGQTIFSQFSPIFAKVFLVFVSLMLFGTQLTVLDSTSRIISENVAIIEGKSRLSRVYYSVIWLQIATGIIVFLSGYSDPITLVVIGAVINALAMACHIIMTYALNTKTLDKKIAPSAIRRIITLASFLIFLVLFVLSVFDAVKKIF